ncbi:MAG: SGNH/GDSL hydrolase family protein, partial [Oscillospiraceae bacterium]|nr:SGNH/GDSL hydrolase family protein [Oscillospiraceae bacterium]
HYNDIVREIAKEEQAELIDIRAAFPAQPEALAPLLCDDGIHPSRSGQKLIYQTLRARLAAAN